MVTNQHHNTQVKGGKGIDSSASHESAERLADAHENDGEDDHEDDEEEQKQQPSQDNVCRVNLDKFATGGVDDNMFEFINDHKAELRFPEKLMLLITHVERECAKRKKCGKDDDDDDNDSEHQACITWTPNGRAFVIRNQHELVEHILPLVFPRGKFPSFTRKLYRWGFRQVLLKAEDCRQQHEASRETTAASSSSSSSSSVATKKCFAHVYFQRDNTKLMAKMQSITAEGMRKAKQLQVPQSSATSPSRLPTQNVEYGKVGSTTTTTTDKRWSGVSLAAVAAVEAGLGIVERDAVLQERMHPQSFHCPLEVGLSTSSLTSLISPSVLAMTSMHPSGFALPSSSHFPALMAAPSAMFGAAHHHHRQPLPMPSWMYSNLAPSLQTPFAAARPQLLQYAQSFLAVSRAQEYYTALPNDGASSLDGPVVRHRHDNALVDYRKQLGPAAGTSKKLILGNPK